MPRPQMDEEILNALWPYMCSEGADDLDLASNSDSAFTSAASEIGDTGSEASAVPTLQQIGQMTEAFRDS